MNKKAIKVISAIFTVAMTLVLLTSTAFAAYTPSSVNTEAELKGINQVTEAGEGIIGAIRTVGILVSVGILMVLGIRYMMGSAEEKASYKKTMVPYLVGAVLIFGASMIAQAVFDFAIDLGK